MWGEEVKEANYYIELNPTVSHPWPRWPLLLVAWWLHSSTALQIITIIHVSTIINTIGKGSRKKEKKAQNKKAVKLVTVWCGGSRSCCEWEVAQVDGRSWGSAWRRSWGSAWDRWVVPLLTNATLRYGKNGQPRDPRTPWVGSRNKFFFLPINNRMVHKS